MSTMESKTLKTNNADKETKTTMSTEPTTEDDITEAAGSNRGKNEAAEEEKSVKWQIPGHHDVTSAKKTLISLLVSLLMYHPGDVTLIDSKKREWMFNETDDEDKFQIECEKISVQIHPVKNKQQRVIRWVAVTRIHSMTTIQEWKNNDHFYSSVAAEETYIFPHPFHYDEWDTTTIGFIKDVHAIHYPKELLQEQLNDMLKKQNKKPPTFQLIPQRITTSDKTATTKAFTVHCLKDDANQLIHLFTHGPFRNETNQIFVPFRYKAKKPDIFKHCIRQQNEVYHKTWIIKLEGITLEAMEYIRTDIARIMGVYHIVPARRLHEVGEWKILVDQSKCAYIHRQLTTNWKTITTKIPLKVLEAAPSTFSIPSISSKRAREYQDADSDNDSYGSLLTTGTDVSMMTTEDSELNDLPEAYHYPTYAEATTNSFKSVQDTQISSPTNSTNTGWQKEKQELQEQIRAQAAQIERIQTDLQSKISRSKDLEDKLAEALELAQSRDERHVEMLNKFAQLMKVHETVCNNNSNPPTEGGYEETSQSLPTTPDRSSTSEYPPPPKKANTNTSPHRHIYSLFRQPPNRSTSRNSSVSRSLPTRKSHASLLTQPMDTDEEPRQLALGAKPSDKME